MGKHQSLLLLLLSLLTTEVCQGEEMTTTMTMSLAELDEIPISTTDMNRYESTTDMKAYRRQILAAQFECYLKMLSDSKKIDSDRYCNRTWDGWLCWEDSLPGVAVQNCPVYFNDFDPSEKVTKVCNPDGQWFKHPESNRLWTNYTLCNMNINETFVIAFTMYYLAVVGHILSVVSLVISIFIFSYFKCLSCQRISLHKNMFMSFILNSVLMVIWFTMLFFDQQLAASHPIGCKILASLIHYISCSNYFWMLCEGIYLHTLIIVAVFVGEQQLGWYYLLGWGFPVIPTLIHVVARLLYHDDKCWVTNTSLLYIIHGPIQVALVVNLFFLLNIVRVLITKLRVTHRTESNVYMKAVRATIILIPLMGVHFILVPLRPEGRLSLAIYEIFMNIFTHFQGLLVAIIFCFSNGEVQAAIRRKSAQYRFQWRRRLTTTDSHSNYHTNSSITENSRVMISLEQAPPCSENEKSLIAIHSLNGQSNGNRHYNGGQEAPRLLDSTDI